MEKGGQFQSTLLPALSHAAGGGGGGVDELRRGR